MEIGVFPRAFSVLPGTSPTPTGHLEVMHVTFQDVGGTVVRVTFGMDDWRGFQAYVADHEQAARAAEARRVLLGPGGLAPSLKTREPH